MAVLDRDTFFSRLQERVGEDTSDESISFVEDMTDTYNELERRATGDGVDWEQRYKDLDDAWKKKYQHRFFSAGGSYSNPTGNQPESEDDKAEKITFGDLFK